jgi:hypothetical protein
MALAAALMQDEVDLPKEEDRPVLPYPSGDRGTPAELSSIWRHAAAAVKMLDRRDHGPSSQEGSHRGQTPTDVTALACIS